MSDEATQPVTVELTKDDRETIDDLVDGSPFNEQALLRAALRIGIQVIKRDPTILMKYLGKKK